MESQWVNSAARSSPTFGYRHQQSSGNWKQHRNSGRFEFSDDFMDGRISPVPDLLMPSLGLNDKIDLSSLINETMGGHFDPDEIMKMDPWAKLDDLIGAVSTSGDGQNVVLLLPAAAAPGQNSGQCLSVDTAPVNGHQAVITRSGGVQSFSSGGIKGVSGTRNGGKFSTARSSAMPYPSIRPKSESRSQTPGAAMYVEARIADVKPGLSLSRPPEPPSVAPRSLQEDPDSEQLFELKREQRKIRNREAAQQSRQRRKEYLESLQLQMEKCIKENERLREENSKLKDENQQLKNGVCPTCSKPGSTPTNGGSGGLRPLMAKSTAVCLLAFMFLLTVNFGPFLNRFSPLQPEPQILQPSVYDMPAHSFHSRALMAVSDDTDVWQDGRAVEAQRRRKRSLRDAPGVGEPSATFVNGTVTSRDCLRLYFNQTESQRLTNELSSWAERHAYFRKVATDMKATGQKTRMGGENETFLKEMASKRQKTRATPTTKRKQQATATKDDKNRRVLGLKRMGQNRELIERRAGFVGPLGFYAEGPGAARDSNDFGLRVFHSLDPYYMQLVEALQKKADTFYLVSFRRDYMLLPASSRNNTAGRRPKMSLVVPALPLNETMMKEIPKNHIPMMQIECEVTATGLISVPEGLVPPFSRSQKEQKENKVKREAKKE